MMRFNLGFNSHNIDQLTLTSPTEFTTRLEQEY